MKHFFSNKNTKERRLIGFAGETPGGAESEQNTPEPAAEKKDASAEKVEKAETPKEVKDAATEAAKNKAEKAGEDSTDAKESVANSELDAAKVDFKAAMDMFAGDPELALAEVNKDGEKYKLNADKSDIELKDVPADDPKEKRDASAETSDEGTEDGKEKLPPLTEDEQVLRDSMMTKPFPGLNEKNAEEFARGMTAIANAIKALRNMFGKAPVDTPDDKNTGKKTDKKEGGPDGADGEDGAEGADGDAGPEGSDATPGVEGGPETGSEAFDPKKSENPKEDGDKMKADIEELKATEGELEGKLKELGAKLDGDTDAAERKEISDEMSTLNEELGKVESQITTKEAEATALDEELARRSDVIDKAWDSATPKGGLVESVALDTEDGNDIVVTLAGGIKFDALPAQQQAALTAMGITPEGNTLVLKDMPPTTYEDAGKAQLDIVINTLAGLKGEVVDEGADGDLEPGADTKEASPETIKAVEELNEQLVNLIESNEQFMTETPIGQILSRMEYKADGENIICSIPAEASGQFKSIMEANGRDVTEDGVNYPDGTTVEVSAGQPIDYPSRLAWGGTEGDPVGQADAAKSGMDQWASIIGKTPPEGTEPIDAQVNEELTVNEATSEGAKRVNDALASLKGRLGSAVDETSFGKFLNSLDAGNTGENIALTSDADPLVFSHMYNEIGIEGSLEGPVEKSADGKYVMTMAEGGADNLVYNLERWAAFMGSDAEGGSGDLDTGSGDETEKPADDKSSDAEKPGDKKPADAEKSEAAEAVTKELEGLKKTLGDKFKSLKDRITVNQEDGTLDVDLKGLNTVAVAALQKLGVGTVSEDGNTLSLDGADAAKIAALSVAAVAVTNKALESKEAEGTSAKEIATKLQARFPKLAENITVDGEDVIIDASKLNPAVKSVAGAALVKMGLEKGDNDTYRVTPENVDAVLAKLDPLV